MEKFKVAIAKDFNLETLDCNFEIVEIEEPTIGDAIIFCENNNDSPEYVVVCPNCRCIRPVN